MLIMFHVALLSLTKTPLWSCLSLRSCKIFFGFGASLLIPLILIMNATFGWASTKKLPAALASLLAFTNAASAALYSLKYFSARLYYSFLVLVLWALSAALLSCLALSKAASLR